MINNISPELVAAIMRQNPLAFTQRVFQHLNPGTAYQHNWHISLIIEKLEQVRRGEVTRLIINMPPRSLKSICCSVAFPAWVLAHQPHKRIITASYSLQLAKKHALDCRNVVESGWYQGLFPATKINAQQNDKFKFQTTRFGSRLATSVGGTLTGEGGDLLILDDPINAAQAQMPITRHKVNEWYQQTLVSRLDDKINGAIILVMQRFHPDDLTGYLLQSGGWEHLSLPLVATTPRQYIIHGKTFTRNNGDLLHGKRDTQAYVDKLKREIGSYAFEAQYQQRPTTQKGEMIKPEWFLHQAASSEGLMVQSWDTAIKSSASSDYSVCITARIHEGISHIMDISRARVEYPELKKRVVSLAERYMADHILIEDKASGQQLIQDLRREGHLPIIPIMPKGDKFSRISAASGMIEAGKIALPNHADWLGDFLNEALNYPNVTHDDQMDALAQLINWLKQRRKDTLNIRPL